MNQFDDIVINYLKRRGYCCTVSFGLDADCSLVYVVRIVKDGIDSNEVKSQARDLKRAHQDAVTMLFGM